jgi:hypothetical protein
MDWKLPVDEDTYEYEQFAQPVGTRVKNRLCGNEGTITAVLSVGDYYHEAWYRVLWDSIDNDLYSFNSYRPDGGPNTKGTRVQEYDIPESDLVAI